VLSHLTLKDAEAGRSAGHQGRGVDAGDGLVRHDNDLFENILRSIYLYTCIPIYLYTYIPIYLYTYIPIYLYTYTPLYLYTCIPIYLHAYTPIYLYIPIDRKSVV
jgi:hypothetical protein